MDEQMLSGEAMEEEIELVAEEVEEETFEEKLEKLLKFMYGQPLHREIYYQVLGFCSERRKLAEIEEFIQSLDSFGRATQSPYYLIEDLQCAGALDLFELDAEGKVVTDADKEGLDEDGIDDLVVDFAYELSELGEAAAEKVSPRARFYELMGGSADNEEEFVAIMGFLTEKRSAMAIDAMLSAWRAQTACQPTVKSTVLVDQLEKAGVIAWQKGWALTKEGKELLSELQA